MGKEKEIMQDRLLEILNNICGNPVYKVIFVEKNGNQVARPVYKLPERLVIRRK